jgi:hypothetical protein
VSAYSSASLMSSSCRSGYASRISAKVMLEPKVRLVGQLSCWPYVCHEVEERT